MKRTPRLHITLIGAGKVGSVLGKLLLEAGDRIVCVVSRTPASARRAGRFLHCRHVSTSLSAIPASTDFLLITTPHSAVEDVARGLAEVPSLDFAHLAACHASGMLTAAALEPLRMRGAVVFSFHPLQTFPRDFAPRDILDRARGIYYGIDGLPRGQRMARLLAAKLHGKTILVPPELRPFYHAACVVASNHLTALLWMLETMFKALKTKEKDFFPVFRPIVMATLGNIEATSPAHALSGPVARGGVQTLAQHLESVRHMTPEVMPYYLQLSLETVRLASAKGSINEEQKTALMDLLQAYGEPAMRGEEAR